MKNWILSSPDEHWRFAKDQQVWAFEDKTSADRMNVGDRLVFYISKSNPPVIAGIAEIVSQSLQAVEPFWPIERREGRIKWPWRINIRVIADGAADARKMADKMQFIRNKAKWGVYLRGSPGNFKQPIPDHDVELMMQALADPPVPYVIQKALIKLDTDVRTSAQPVPVVPPVDGFLPPVLSHLERLAAYDPPIKDTEDEFESRVWDAGRALGFYVKELGHKMRGKREPDAVFSLHREKRHFGVVVDAKARQAGYSFGTDDRAIVEYLDSKQQELLGEGVDPKHTYYAVISSTFIGNYEEVANRIEEETGCRRVVLLPARTVQAMVVRRLKTPSFDQEIEGLLLRSKERIIRQIETASI